MENAGKKTPACRGFGFGHRAYRRICGCHGGRGRTRAFRRSRAGSAGCRAFRGSRTGSEGCRAFRGSRAGSAGRRAGGLVDGVLEEVFAGGKRFANNRLRVLAADFQHVAQVARARGFRAHVGARRPRRVVGNVQRKRGDRRASDRSQQAAAVKADARPKGRGGGHGERDRQRGSRLARGQRDFGFRVVAVRQLAPV